MKLGVFDSGIGGKAVAEALSRTFPDATITTVNDAKNVPYGDKTPREVIALTDTAIQPLLRQHCDIVILACNTATALAISTLRDRYPTQKFIGIEPMIKTAAATTKSKTIAVCATPATLASDRYKTLITRHAAHLTILEPDCSNWAYMIENNQVNRRQIIDAINTVCEEGADVIVLGCTHYHWIKTMIAEIAGDRAVILEPSEAISQRVASLITLPDNYS
ncbi:MAG TPA: aspartate/glutamate racemase family protein [Candidatus Saccharimonadales bacterium]|nr:aspartate/glutamate racemase family protein [Candidatus Saccharimonadales bacterium]